MLRKFLRPLGLLLLFGCGTTYVDGYKPASNQLQTSKVEDKGACIPFPVSLKSMPKFVPQHSLVVSSFTKTCTLGNGKDGYRLGSSWTVMGFPCTGGGGTYEWKGSRYNPKLVYFNFENSCPMIGENRSEIEESLATELGIPAESKLIAYYPFSVSYWEVDEFSDAGVGFKMELFSVDGRRKIWSRFNGMAPVKVFLYGRKNALVRSKNFYKVTGLIQKDVESESFRFTVETVELLSEADQNQLVESCQKLKPRRNCHEIL